MAPSSKAVPWKEMSGLTGLQRAPIVVLNRDRRKIDFKCDSAAVATASVLHVRHKP